MSFDPGHRLGPYELLAPLGAGGMGVLYRARDTRLDREVAVKLLSASSSRDGEARRRFRREALALSRLNHPNIETVYDFGREQEIDYLVLELVPGETVAARLARGPISEREAAEIAAQVAEALEEAHERGVQHRDLKPSNLMLTPKGRVKVLDFGVARLERLAPEATVTEGLTESGGTIGTLAYMAPEQLLGEQLDVRADLYSLGVVLYEMVTGQRPFRAALSTALTNEILHGAVLSPRILVPTLSPRAEAIVSRSIQREAPRRYQSAGEMLGELRGLAQGRGVESRLDAAVAAHAPERRITSIVVLPLENLSGDPEQEYFADGMTEELIACLAQVRALRIISRTSAMRYKGARKPLGEIAGELNVDAVVEGSVRRAGNRVRITAQLVDAQRDEHLWAKSYERDLKDVLALQGEVAQAIVQEIQVSVTPQEEARLRSARAIPPEAYEAYLKGRYHWEQRSEPSLRRALGHFEEAARFDPTYALAEVGIADVHNLLGFYTHVPPREAFPKAKSAALRALEIEPTSSEAHTSLAYPVLYHDWDMKEAERLFRKSIELNPKYPVAHLWYANVLMLTDREDDALAEFRTARSLDPLSMISNTGMGWVAYYYRRFDEAVQNLHRTLELDPNVVFACYWLGLSEAALGRHAESQVAMERCLEVGGRVPYTIAGLAIARARAGNAHEARNLLGELETLGKTSYVSSYYRAQVLAALEERDAGLAALEGALEERAHWLTFAHLDAVLDPLREDSRFDAVIRRVGISPRA